MKLIDYFINITFLVSISLFASILAGPRLINMGVNGTENDIDSVLVNGLTLDYLNGNVAEYLQLKVFLNNKSYGYIYRVEENKHKDLEMFLRTNNFLKGRNIENCKIGSDDLPISLNKVELPKNLYAKVKFNNKSIITYLALGDYVVIGRKDSLLKRMLMIIMGVVLVLMGCILFIIGGFAIHNNYRIYKSTGIIPPLPNRIDDMKEGLMFLFK